MLPAAHRLRTAADFQQTTRRGRKVARGSVVIYLSRSDSPAPARVGLVVSSAVGGSVVRHRAARRIRGVIRSLVAGLPGGSHVIVRALPGADRDRDLGRHIAEGLHLLLGEAP